MEDGEFKQKLTPEQYRVMRQKGTETPHTGKYWDHDESGIYKCAACGNILFLSTRKFHSEDGWPAFKRPASARAIALSKEGERTEISCKKCGSHLGYFVDGKRYQINSIALDFQELPDLEWDEEDGEDSEDKEQKAEKPSTSRTISFTIGGLTIGAALGAGAMWYSAPAAICAPDAAQVQQIPSGSSATTSAPRPSGTTKKPSASSGSAFSPAPLPTASSTATTSSPRPAPAGATPSPATTTL